MLFCPENIHLRQSRSASDDSLASCCCSVVKVKDVTVGAERPQPPGSGYWMPLKCLSAVHQRFCLGFIMFEGYCKHNPY